MRSLNEIYDVLDDEILYCRKPTQYEIKFGEGATHYMVFKKTDVVKSNGEFKVWFINKGDGLRYDKC